MVRVVWPQPVQYQYLGQPRSRHRAIDGYASPPRQLQAAPNLGVAGTGDGRELEGTQHARPCLVTVVPTHRTADLRVQRRAATATISEYLIAAQPAVLFTRAPTVYRCLASGARGGSATQNLREVLWRWCGGAPAAGAGGAQLPISVARTWTRIGREPPSTAGSSWTQPDT